MGRRPSTIESDVARFMSKVRMNEGGCWIWTGGMFREEYGAFHANGKTFRAHRWSLENIGRKPIPEGLMVRHLCNTTACVNPDHLEPGTHRQNMDDVIAARTRKGDRAKITAADAVRIREMHANGMVQVAIGAAFGVSAKTISLVLSGKRTF